MVQKKTVFSKLTIKILFYVYVTLLKLYGVNGTVDYRISKHHSCLSPNSMLYNIVGIPVQQCIDECASLSKL